MERILVHEHSAGGARLDENPYSLLRLQEKRLGMPITLPRAVSVNQKRYKERLADGAIEVITVGPYPSATVRER